MTYESPKAFIRKLDQLFLVFMSAPIIVFFVYLIYVLNNTKFNDIEVRALGQVKLMVLYSVFVVFTVVFLIWKTKLIQKVKQVTELQHKFELIEKWYLQYSIGMCVVFSGFFVVFAYSRYMFASLPLWLLVGLISIEKPSVYRIGKMLKFRTKKEFESFVKDEPFNA